MLRVEVNGSIIEQQKLKTGKQEKLYYAEIELSKHKQQEERLFRRFESGGLLSLIRGQKTHRKAVLSMLEKIMVLHEMKLMGIDISASLEKMYEKYGKEEFQHSAMVSGYGFILQ